jgi:hypothetical protein
MRGDGESGVTALFNRNDFADIGDNSGEQLGLS